MTTIYVCVGSACHLKGSYNVINAIQKIIKERDLEDQVTVKAAFCLGRCTEAVSVKVNDGPIVSVNEETVDKFMEEWVILGGYQIEFI